ncbi:MAG: transglycosylase SLT domain-containing protein [gamma proteobacterium symbiont of Bathyaustriella thionipta]|nr:transglycosylase SLT domain-containing protein [gamma proteobacterium symbiont of Bathyaustriella thionipta]
MRGITGALILLCNSPLLWAAQAPPGPEFFNKLEHVIEESSSFVDRFEAEAWLMDMSYRLSSRLQDADERLYILKTVHREAKRVNLPPDLILSVIQIESNFDYYALSHAGARGLMQVMPFWKNEIGKPDDNLFDIETNLRYGCTILRTYIDMENGRIGPALARYNGSVGKTRYPDLVEKAHRRKWYP